MHKPRISLRFALLLLTAIAVLIGSWANRARQQAAAVASLRAGGALVIYDQQKLDASGQWVSKFQSPFLPKALIDWLGPDYFVSVDMVWPCATRDLPLAAKLHSLQYLALVGDDQHPDFTALSRCRFPHLFDHPVARPRRRGTGNHWTIACHRARGTLWQRKNHPARAKRPGEVAVAAIRRHPRLC